jgi:hypothetical protein
MGCPLNNIDFCNKNSGEKTNADFPEVERRTMAWAVEHPEPVYPSWGAWLEKQGVVKLVQEDGASYYALLREIEDPISPDIAQKLGIEPKEG